MAYKILPSYKLLSENKYTANAGPDGLPRTRVIADFDFSASDTMQMVKNGVSFDGSPNRTIDAAPGYSVKGANFNFNAYPLPDPDAPFDEQRFAFPEMSELCIEMDFQVPTNYFHRACLNLDIVGDVSGWQIGDDIVGADGVSHGSLYAKYGLSIVLLNPDNFIYSGGVWTGNITNATRGETRAAIRVGGSHNNKLFALWCDGYSSSGASPSFAWEMHADMSGGSVLFYHFGADYQVAGSLDNSTSDEVPFIAVPADRGKIKKLLFYVKMATSESTPDGIVRTYLKNEGDSSYTKILEQDNALIGARAASSFAEFMHGYLHGQPNSCYEEFTTFRDMRFTLYNRLPDGVNL